MTSGHSWTGAKNEKTRSEKLNMGSQMPVAPAPATNTPPPATTAPATSVPVENSKTATPDPVPAK